MISFRPLTEDDYPTLLEWLQRPHVKGWWDDGDDTPEKVALHYGSNDGTKRFVLLLRHDSGGKSVAAGYFQYYRNEKGEIGIDQFLSEPDHLNKGIGTEAIKRFIELVVDRENPKTIIIDPIPKNHRAIRCYEKVGFKYRDTVKGWNDELVYLMEMKLNP